MAICLGSVQTKPGRWRISGAERDLKTKETYLAGIQARDPSHRSASKLARRRDGLGRC